MRRIITTRLGAFRSRMEMPGESGQGLAEYALVLAFIAVVCVAALGFLGQGIANSVGWRLFDLF